MGSLRQEILEHFEVQKQHSTPTLSQSRAVAPGKVTCIYLLSNSATPDPEPWTPFLSFAMALLAPQEGLCLWNRTLVEEEFPQAYLASPRVFHLSKRACVGWVEAGSKHRCYL